MSLWGSRFEVESIECELKLAGEHQIENALTALSALFYFRNKKLLSMSDEDILDGLQNAANPARLELLCKEPPVILDGAHNPNGVEALKKAIEEFLPEAPLTCVMGMLADKDTDTAVSLLNGVFQRVYTVPVDNPRAMDSGTLAEKFRAGGTQAKAFDSAGEAIDRAVEIAEAEGGAVIICGSLYLAGEVRPYLLKKFD